ncbi:2054_t:CDS:2, partial [Cetraspora pellucida]
LEFGYLKVEKDQICFEHYIKIINFIQDLKSNNEFLKDYIDLADIIETSKFIPNSSNIPINYLKFFEDQQVTNLTTNNFSNIKLKIVENGIFFDKTNFNKLINIIVNQKIEDNNNNSTQIYPNCFKQLIEAEESQLIGFLDEMTNALVSKRRTEKNIKKT